MKLLTNMNNSKGVIGILIAALIISLSGLLYVLFLYRQQAYSFDQEKSALQNSIANQKKDKDTISYIWEEQAAANDVLVNRQTVVLDKISAYLANVQASIQFINTVPQLTPTASEEGFKNNLNNLRASIDELNVVTKNNNTKKEENKLKIETIYQQAGEDLKNRANPDGIK